MSNPSGCGCLFGASVIGAIVGAMVGVVLSGGHGMGAFAVGLYGGAFVGGLGLPIVATWLQWSTQK